jgi:hypothetical protein
MVLLAGIPVILPADFLQDAGQVAGFGFRVAGWRVPDGVSLRFPFFGTPGLSDRRPPTADRRRPPADR